MSLKLVVWDWNGTLFDDTDILVQAVNSAESPIYGIPEITVEEYQELYEVPIKNWFAKMGVDSETFQRLSQQAANAFERDYEAAALHAPIRIGAREVLIMLRNNGIDQIILSNHTLEGIYLQLARLDIEQYIRTVLANDIIGGAHFRGKQERLANYLKENGIAASSVVIIGDTQEEVHIGKNLGLSTIAITGGACSEARLHQTKPDRLIHSLEELRNIIEELA